MNDTGTEIS